MADPYTRLLCPEAVIPQRGDSAPAPPAVPRVMKPTLSAVAPIVHPYPASVLDELRRWRLAAELRYVAKSMKSSQGKK